MEDILKKLIRETEELETKINNLENFFYSTTFQDLSKANKILLKKQRVAMEDYLSILAIRVELLSLFDSK